MGVGGPELMMVLVVLVSLFGAARLPQLARSRWIEPELVPATIPVRRRR